MEVLLERIKELCKSRGITVSQLEDKLDFSPNTIYQWKKRIPGTKKLQAVADYFSTSIDYLLGRSNVSTVNSDSDLNEMTVEKALESVMGDDGKPLTENDREILAGMIAAYLEKKKG